MAQFNQVGRCRKCGRAIHSTDSFSYQLTGNDAYYVCERCLEGKGKYDFMNQLNHTSSTRDCMVNQTATERLPEGGQSDIPNTAVGYFPPPSHIDEMSKVFGAYAGRAKIAIEEAEKTKYTDAKQTMLLAQVALGLAWIADEIAELRRGDKDGKP